MKKNLLYLFTLLCSLGLFVACGDDDDPAEKVDESWKELTDTYQASANSITLGKAALTGQEKAVAVNATSAEAATIKLTNIVPDAKEVSVNAVLTKTGDLYSIAGETTEGSCKIAVSGSFAADGKLTLAVTRTLSSAVTGNLALQFVDIDGIPGLPRTVPVHWVAEIGDPTVDAQLAAIGPMLGGLIAGKVSAVDVALGTDGVFNVTWTKLGESTPTGLSDIANGMVAGIIGDIYYTTKDGVLYVALDKSVIALLDTFSGLIEAAGINITEIIGLMTDMGGYYGLPLAYVQADGITTFKMDKAQLLPVLNILGPIILQSLPEEMQGLGQLLQLLPDAQQLELGLPFIKK